LQREVDLLDRLIHGCYRAFGRFELMGPYTMYYFTGAHQSETRRRQGKAEPGDGFLFAHHAPFRSALSRGYEALLELTAGPFVASDAADAFQARVAQDIAPYNNAGFCDPAKKNMYPYI